MHVRTWKKKNNPSIEFPSRKIAGLLILLLFCSPNFNALDLNKYPNKYPFLKLKSIVPVKGEGSHLFDSDYGFNPEVYVFERKENKKKTYLYVFNLYGDLIYRTLFRDVELYAKKYKYKQLGDEEVILLYPTSLDEDDDLDILLATNIKTSGKFEVPINEQRLYLYERVYDEWFNRHKNEFRWELVPRDLITDIAVANEDSRGEEKKVIASSLDWHVYVLSINGEILEKYKLNSAPWCIALMKNQKDIAVGAYDGVYLIKNSSVVKIYNSDNRIIDIDVGDIDDDSKEEILALDSKGTLILLEQGGGIILKHKVDALAIKFLDLSKYLTFNNKKILLIKNRGIEILNYPLSLDWSYHIGERILSFDIYPRENPKFFVFGCAYNTYIFEVNPKFFVFRDGLVYYESARNSFFSNNCSSAYKAAEKCKEIMEKINEDEYVFRCKMIMNRCQANISENMSKIAMEYYENATKFFEKNIWDAALLNAKAALDMFIKLKNISMVLKIDLFIKDVESRIESLGNESLKKSIENLRDGNYEDALRNAEIAKNLFLKINKTSLVRESDRVIETAKLYISAEKYIDLSKKFFENESYDEALNYLDLAMNIHRNLNSSRLEELEKERKKILSYKNASNYMLKSAKKLMENNLDEAEFYAEKAKDIYLKYSDDKKLDEVNRLLSKINEKRNEEFYKMLENIGMLSVLFVFIAILGILGGYILVRRRRIAKISQLKNEDEEIIDEILSKRRGDNQ